jgi:hypothetical protein
MARAEQGTIDELRKLLAKQQGIESSWFALKHKISETELKDEIAVALCAAKDRLQFLVDSFPK